MTERERFEAAYRKIPTITATMETAWLCWQAALTRREVTDSTQSPPGSAGSDKPIAWRQLIGDKWAYFDIDPRTVHDNGRPVEPVYATAQEDALDAKRLMTVARHLGASRLQRALDCSYMEALEICRRAGMYQNEVPHSRRREGNVSERVISTHGIRDAIVAYSDTGWAADWWAARVDQAEGWVRSLGYEHARIPSEGMEALVRRKKAWPRGGGGKFQFCTEALKERPALEWMDDMDPKGDAVCMIGVRREESANRATFPEWTEESPRHGGRSLHAPLVLHTSAMRDELIYQTPFIPLPYRSKECYPCVNAGKRELKLLDGEAIIKIRNLEAEMGTNSKGNERVMFSPARHGGAVGIDAVVRDAAGDTPSFLETAMCDSGWCE